MLNSGYPFQLDYGWAYDNYQNSLESIRLVDETLSDIPYDEHFNVHADRVFEMSHKLIDTVFELESMFHTQEREMDRLQKLVNSLQEKES